MQEKRREEQAGGHALLISCDLTTEALQSTSTKTISRGQMWKGKHQKVRQDLSLSKMQWTASHECRGVSRSQARLLDSIDLSFQLACGGDESRDWWCACRLVTAN